MHRRTRGLVLLGFVVPVLAAGCGAGVAGVAASSGGSSGGSSAPAIVNLSLDQTKRTPARIEFELQNASAEVELRYHRPGDPPATFLRMEHVSALAANPIVLAPGRVTAFWTFSAEAGIDPDGGFDSEVEIEVAIVGQPSGSRRAGGGVGNDLPRIESVAAAIDPLAGEVSGIVLVEGTLEDTPGDRADLRVEFSLDGTSWSLARPAQNDATPPFAFTNLVVEPDGTPIAFFWDTAEDLGDADTDVLIRFTPFEVVEDALERGTPLASTPFHLDNNEEPIVQLFNDAVLADLDQRRGIPVPFRMIDEEGDPVEVIFQWRRQGEGFPELPEDRTELAELLADPASRRAKHICTEYARYARGRVMPVAPNTVRLPELAAGESWILAAGLEGRRLELMRRSGVPEPITPTWRENPLVSPIAALPVGDGLHALVLDAPGGTGRLREIELATGEIAREVATLGPGLPTAMTIEDGGEAVLVASDLGATWRLERVDLVSGDVTELFTSDASMEPPPVRGLASSGTASLLLTAGSSLLHLDYRGARAPRLGVIRDRLATPWGIVVDPLTRNGVYVAERDAARADGTGRVLALELDSHGSLPVVVRSGSLVALEEPTSLALDERGARLLAVTATSLSMRRLTGVNLGGRGGNVPYALGEPFLAGAVGLASGPDRLVLLALPDANECLVGGGVEQRRTIVAHPSGAAYEPGGQRVVVDEAFDPAPEENQAYRVRSGPPRHATSGGTNGVFLWDCSEVPGESAFLRGTPRDDEVGLAGEAVAAKEVRAPLNVDPVRLGNPFTTNVPSAVATADLDSDGALDIVSANQVGHNLRLFFQGSPRSFSRTQVLGNASTTTGPRSVAVADLDDDGDADVVCANSLGSSLTAFFQLSPGSFSPCLLPTASGPNSVAAADLDGDGDLDLVSANNGGENLTVFFQLSPCNFDPVPVPLGGPGVTGGPFSVAAGDLDGDGDVDVASANNSGNDLTAFFQLSPGTFDLDPLRLGSFTTTKAPGTILASDLDGDGALDLISANSSVDLALFYQRNPGEFDPLPAVLGATDFPSDVRAADLDGDGDQDLVTVNLFNDDLRIFTQVAGSFDPLPLALEINSTQRDGPVAVAIGDLDGDGRQDLVTANLDSSNLTVFFQDPPGDFAPVPLVLGSILATNIPVCVAAADLDGDGDQELVSANRLGRNLTIFHQLSPRIFDPIPLAIGGSSTTLSHLFVAAADLDTDGDQDLVSANQSSLTIFFQRPPGSFDPSPLLLGDSLTTSQPACVAAADLDGDGDLDLASANRSGNNLTVFFQTPSGFDPSPLPLGDLATTNAPVFVLASDLDDDGGVDLVSANEVGNSTVFYQGSSGTFAPDPLDFGSFAVAAADLDGDGDQDLVFASVSDNGLAVFQQVEPRSFELAQTLAGVGAPVSISAADLDRDGDVDLAFAAGNDLKVLFQVSPGRFDPTPVVRGGQGITESPAFILATDIDGDGDPDLASANTFINTRNLTVFWGGD